MTQEKIDQAPPPPTPLVAPQSHPAVMARPVSLVSLASAASSSPFSGSSESAESIAATAASLTNHAAQPPAAVVSNNLDLPSSARGSVHILWSVSDVPFPSSLSPSFVLERVHRIAETYGAISTFKVISQYDAGTGGGLSMPLKQCLHDHGVEIEEVYSRSPQQSSSIDLAIMTNLLRISINEVEQQTQQLYQGRGGGHSSSVRGSTLILLANQEEFARALHVLRRSNRFVDVVLIYHQQANSTTLLPNAQPVSLIRHATISFEWSQLLRHGLSPQTILRFDATRSIAPAANTPPPMQQQPMMHERRDMHTRSSSSKDLPSLAPSHHHGGSGSSGSFSMLSSSAASSGFNSRASTPSSGRSSNALLPSSNFSFGSSASSSRSSSISSHPSIDSQLSTSSSAAATTAGGRTLMGGTIDVAPNAFDSNTTNIGELSVELKLERLSPKLKAMVLAMKSVLQCQ